MSKTYHDQESYQRERIAELEVECQQLRAKLQQTGEVVEATRKDSLKINNLHSHNMNSRQPLSVQIPVRLIFAADVLLREMCMRGGTSAELTLRYGVNPVGETSWIANYGGFTCWNSTPWGAMELLGSAMENHLYGATPE